MRPEELINHIYPSTVKCLLVACLGRLQKVGRARTGAGELTGARVEASAEEIYEA